MIDLEARFTALTNKWLSLIGPEHHKDRDCHFYIERVWSYGESPKWHAYHTGYWINPDFSYWTDDYEDALKKMIGMLVLEIAEAERALEQSREGTVMWTLESLVSQLMALETKYMDLQYNYANLIHEYEQLKERHESRNRHREYDGSQDDPRCEDSQPGHRGS